MLYPNLDVSEMFVDRQSQRSSLHTRYLNEQLVRVLKTIGYDVGFRSGQGQYLFDRTSERYLDLFDEFDLGPLQESVQFFDVGLIEVELGHGSSDLGEGEHSELLTPADEALDLFEFLQIRY